MNLSSFSSRRLIGTAASTCALALTAAISAAGVLSPAAAQGRSAGASPAKCTTSKLVVWLNTQGDAAAGSTFFHLELANLSDHACTLVGYPGVSGVDLAGHRLGTPASRNSSPVRVITLARGASASAVLRIVVAGNFPSSRCRPVTGAGLRVYPPNNTASKVVPFVFNACSRTGPVYLSVGAVTK